jgi:transposase InsO family protein
VTPFERVYPSNWNLESLKAAEKQLLFWHRLFGHASLRKIRSLVKHQIGIRLPKELPARHIHCPVCAISKLTSVNPVTSFMRKPEKLDILCTDLMSPFPEPTPEGALYLLTLRDAATGYSYARLLKTKDKANNVLVEVITELETQVKKSVKILRSDNRGEFANKVLKGFLAGKGIIAERSLPYHHSQNGVIERFNRTIAEMGRTILSDSKLPRSFWGYAFQWANHVLNRIPNKSSGEKTPFERMFDRPPGYDGFRVFGSKAYVHIPP